MSAYSITKAVYSKRKDIFKLIHKKSAIKINTSVIEKILPFLSNYEGKIEFSNGINCSDINKCYIEKKTLRITVKVFEFDLILKHCEKWIECIEFFDFYKKYGFDSLHFSKLKHLIFLDQTIEDESFSYLIKSCCNTIQTIWHPKYNSRILYLLIKQNIVFPKLWRILTFGFSALRPFDQENFPMLMYTNYLESIPSYITKNNVKIALNNLECYIYGITLQNKYKYKAIITFILCLKKTKIVKPVQEIIKKMLLKISNEYWENCVTNKDYDIFENDSIIVTDPKEPLLEQYNNVILSERRFDYNILFKKRDIENYKDEIKKYEKDILLLEKSKQETLIQKEQIYNEIEIKYKKQKL